LLVANRERLQDVAFRQLVDCLPADAVLIVNDTKVIKARVFGHKPTGGAVEFLFLRPHVDTIVNATNATNATATIALPAGMSAWRCVARARGALRAGQTVAVGEHTLLLLSDRDADADGTIIVAAPGDGLDFFAQVGRLPLPPYIERARLDQNDAVDDERYQTMFAAKPGAIAAPTAGLHMTDAVRQQLTSQGITIAPITLHVGWGTFAPIRSDDLSAHVMHFERYDISAATAALVASGRPIVALGTTVLRALEAAALAANATPTQKQVKIGAGETNLFIHPQSGHHFAIVDHLITNFHLPESTLLMLVSAFAGTPRVAAAYRHAIANRYRFFSYGDAMLLSRLPLDAGQAGNSSDVRTSLTFRQCLTCEA
jgi:S-adenosylmethionine:tRNA ribosyltransferase-isomerase